MPYRFIGLSPAPFVQLLSLDDEALTARGMRRMIADEKPGFPCRVSLEDAEPGERVLLVPFEHQPAHSPYRASGPIFVREMAHSAFNRAGDVPASLVSRVLSVRAYDNGGMMVDADVTQGAELEALLDRLFAQESVDYAHVHYARRGCYAARVEQAG